jgi:hypothetical protein
MEWAAPRVASQAEVIIDAVFPMRDHADLIVTLAILHGTLATVCTRGISHLSWEAVCILICARVLKTEFVHRAVIIAVTRRISVESGLDEVALVVTTIRSEAVSIWVELRGVWVLWADINGVDQAITVGVL